MSHGAAPPWERLVQHVLFRCACATRTSILVRTAWISSTQWRFEPLASMPRGIAKDLHI
ncbi:Hypothetical protein A7982_08352 [Minicystis rosea]|nr:Hypothetical protein A7982_08352 [Minicystis rosea]